jgi:hypothetical protein
MRLLVPAPYVDESLSSFLGRAAQAYRVEPRLLIRELATGLKWGQGRRDLDRAAPDGFLQRLADAVPGWQSPIDGIVGFQEWSLAPAQRFAYCPLCFQEDLVAARVPYFRRDWMAALVTHCWQHDTPLFDWEDRERQGKRHWPTAWVDQSSSAPDTFPTFFRRHLSVLEDLNAESPSHEDGPSLHDHLRLLSLFQMQFEKSISSAYLPRCDGHVTRTRELARRLIYFAIGVDTPESRAAPPAELLRPPTRPGWFGPAPLGYRPRAHEFRDSSIRQEGRLPWRRSVVWFAASMMAGHDPGGLVAAELLHWPAWATWWTDTVRSNSPNAYWEQIQRMLPARRMSHERFAR